MSGRGGVGRGRGEAAWRGGGGATALTRPHARRWLDVGVEAGVGGGVDGRHGVEGRGRIVHVDHLVRAGRGVASSAPGRPPDDDVDLSLGVQVLHGAELLQVHPHVELLAGVALLVHSLERHEGPAQRGVLPQALGEHLDLEVGRLLQPRVQVQAEPLRPLAFQVPLRVERALLGHGRRDEIVACAVQLGALGVHKEAAGVRVNGAGHVRQLPRLGQDDIEAGPHGWVRFGWPPRGGSAGGGVSGVSTSGARAEAFVRDVPGLMARRWSRCWVTAAWVVMGDGQNNCRSPKCGGTAALVPR